MNDKVADELAEHFPGVTTFVVIPQDDWLTLAKHLRRVGIPPEIRDMHVQVIELETQP